MRHFFINKILKPSYGEQKPAAIADKPPDACVCRCSMLCCQKLPSDKWHNWLQFIGRIFRLLLTPLPFDASVTGIPSSCWVHIWYGKTRMPGLQSGKGRMMIDSVVWAQYINVTDTETDRQIDSHVAIANAAPTHCVGQQKTVHRQGWTFVRQLMSWLSTNA